MNNKDIGEWTIQDFKNLPYREDKHIELLHKTRRFVILPLETLHDSGFRNMEFVVCEGDVPVCRTGGSSDVLRLINSDKWQMDCLPTSGLLRVWNAGNTVDMRGLVRVWCAGNTIDMSGVGDTFDAVVNSLGVNNGNSV